MTPPGCAERPALPVSQAVSGRAVANDIFGGCGSGVKPWRDRLMEAGELAPVVQVGGPPPSPGPAPAPRPETRTAGPASVRPPLAHPLLPHPPPPPHQHPPPPP